MTAPSAPVAPPVRDTDDGSIPDGEMGRAIVKGSVIGIPVVFAIIFVIDLVAGLTVPLAALGASIPGVIFGSFIGSAFFIGKASDAALARAKASGTAH